MPVMYIIIGLTAGKAAVDSISDGGNWIVWLIMQGITFAAGIAIVLYGVRMFLAAMIPAFEASAKNAPGTQPALDSPVFFQYSPAGSMLGFVSCFVTMVIFTWYRLQSQPGRHLPRPLLLLSMAPWPECSVIFTAVG
jgi:PTS system ascorbate-specific IIC component